MQLSISEILSNLLQINNITEYELANKINIPRQTINKIINKKTIDPKSSTLLKIAEFFNVSIDELLGNSIKNTNSTISLESIEINIIPFDKLEQITPQQVFDVNVSNNRIKISIDNHTDKTKIFAITINDNSMLPRFTKNDILIFSVTSHYTNFNYVLSFIKKQSKYLFRKYTYKDVKV